MFHFHQHCNFRILDFLFRTAKCTDSNHCNEAETSKLQFFCQLLKNPQSSFSKRKSSWLYSVLFILFTVLFFSRGPDTKKNTQYKCYYILYFTDKNTLFFKEIFYFYFFGAMALLITEHAQSILKQEQYDTHKNMFG